MSEIAGAAPAANRKPGSLVWIRRWLRDDPRAALSVAYLSALVVVAATAPLTAPYSPVAQDVANALQPPNAAHLLGADDLGRDVLSRLIYGAPTTLYASFLAVAVACVIGVPVGLAAGVLGGWLDEIISRLIDTLLSFPAIVLAIAVTGALGVGLTNGMIAVGIVFSPSLARLARAQTLVAKRHLYVEAARGIGASPARIVWRHIIPNVIQPTIVQVTTLLAVALLAELSLSFLGLGVQPPQPSWGAMLARAYGYMDIAPDQMYAPGIAIMLTALAFNALGESLRLALDPTQRSR